MNETDQATADESAESAAAAMRAPVPAAGFAAAGAAAAGAAGAAAGSLAGPIGAAIGASLAAVAGGVGGAALGSLFDPSSRENEEHWREHYSKRPDADPGDTFDDFLGAYQSGYETYFVCPECPEFNDEIARERYTTRGGRLIWAHAREAARAAWEIARERKPSPPA